MCIFHKWSKWVQYTESGTVVTRVFNKQLPPVQYDEARQKRICTKCNKVQDEKVQ